MRALALCGLPLLALLAPAAAGGDAEPEAVVLVHGLARTDRSMSELSERLSEAGFRAHIVRYPSTDEPPERLVAFVADAAQTCCADAPALHFVGHSLGGLLVRAHLAEQRPDRLGRIVLIAPPNQGSEIVDTLGDTALFRWLYGPTGSQLGTDEASFPNRLPNPDYALGVIAGTASINPIGSAFLPGEDDGAVAVERTRLPGMRDFVTVERTHTFIMGAPETAAHVVHFLRYGHFESDSGPPHDVVDEGACPFECCTYREWTVLEALDVRESPEPDSPRAFALRKGEVVTGATGFVLTREPGRVDVLESHTGETGKIYAAGDSIFVYTNLGEGFARVWYDGEMYSEDVHTRVERLEGRSICAERGSCWARWTRAPSAVWWAQVRNAAGRTGWTTSTRSFSEVDACS